MAGRTKSIKCPYEQKKECSSECIHTKTCARWKEITKVGLCKDCDPHAAGCHAMCKAYGLWRAEREKERKTICEKQKERHGSMELCKVRIGENAEKTEK